MAHTRKILNHWDTKVFQKLSRTNSRELKYLRAVDGASGHNDLKFCFYVTDFLSLTRDKLFYKIRKEVVCPVASVLYLNASSFFSEEVYLAYSTARKQMVIWP